MAKAQQNNSFFELMGKFGHEQVVFCQDSTVGLSAVIAIHDTTLGPAIGGVRMYDYASPEAALDDVLRLSRAMTYKSAISGVNLGGGNAVIMGDPRRQKTEFLLRRFGQFVEQLSGRFIASLDLGITPRDIEYFHMETSYVAGLPKSLGGRGDTAPFTAKGVYYGIKASLKELYGNDNLAGRTVAVHGAGNVGEQLISLLRAENAKVYVSDIDEYRMAEVANKYKAVPVASHSIYELPVDVYAPCAFGGIINSETIPRLKCAIIAGSANNQLKNEVEDTAMLKEYNMLYAPDYLINAGGLISAYTEVAGHGASRIAALTEGIYDTTRLVIRSAIDKQISTVQAANELTEVRLAGLRNIKRN